MQNAINWFEIPVADLARATAFYAAVLGTELWVERFQDTGIATFGYAAAQHGVGGALVSDARRTPSPQGSVVYLNAGSDIRAAVDRVAEAGGGVGLAVTDIGAPPASSRSSGTPKAT